MLLLNMGTIAAGLPAMDRRLPYPTSNPPPSCPVQASAQQRMGALRTALRLGRHLTVSFGEPAASGGVGAQQPLVQQLVAAVDSLPASADLAGLTVMIGAANGVDALGTIWLAADGSEAGWARWDGRWHTLSCLVAGGATLSCVVACDAAGGCCCWPPCRLQLLLVGTRCFQVLHHNTLSSIQSLPQLPGGR